MFRNVRGISKKVVQNAHLDAMELYGEMESATKPVSMKHVVGTVANAASTNTVQLYRVMITVMKAVTTKLAHGMVRIALAAGILTARQIYLAMDSVTKHVITNSAIRMAEIVGNLINSELFNQTAFNIRSIFALSSTTPEFA